ncbi:hypothetical protein BGW42_006427 [Actinomortierella wolfii]|nr:hypothetical protein BGW42_006427 [Actinomortierella wolfii]
MYLERLAAIQQLDPDLGRQLGLVQSPSVADANGVQEHTSLSEDTKSIGDPSKSKKSERVVCSRCHSLTYHGTPLPPTADNIPSTGFFPAPTAPEPLFLQKIHNTPTNNVAVVVVSLLDFPLSLPQPVVDLLLSPRNLKQTSKDDKKVHKQRTILKTPVVIVANKFDLLPEGSNKDRVIEYLWRWFEDRDLHRNIQRIHVVSAKHPSGGDIRVLLKSLGNLWHDSDKGHITMIGAENVGKSALLNAMVREGGLNSGRLAGAQIQLIKERMDGEALQKKHKAQLQHLMLTAGKILSPEEQEEKLELERAIQSWNERKRVIDESANLSANADDPFSTTSAKYTTTVSNIPGTTLSKIKIPLAILARHFKSDYTMFKKRYLIDTPGIRADDDFTTKLTLDELKVSLPKKVLSPMSFMVEEGKSFFMGGLIRIDCLPQDTSVPLDSTSESKAVRRPRALKLTFFTTLPLHKTSMAQANQLVKQSSMGQLTTLQPPFGSPERLALFPPLTPIRQGLIRIDIPLKHKVEEDGLDNLDIIRRRERSVDKRGRRILPFDKFEGICDIVFAGGLGWIMVSALPTADVVSPIRLRVWTPEGKGLAIRPKPLLPNLADDHLDRTAGGIRQKRKVFQPLPKKDVDSSTFSESDEVHSSTTL